MNEDMKGKRWITFHGRRILINDKGNVIKKKEKKVDYQKYLETRKNSIAGFIAVDGIVENLSEKKANELLNLGIEEELLPYVYPIKDDYNLEEAFKYSDGGKEEWIRRFRESAIRKKEEDEEYQVKKAKWGQEQEARDNAEKLIEHLSKNYDGNGDKKFKDYENDDIKCELDPETLHTITDAWAYKDDTEGYFDELDYDTQKAIEDYTSQTEHYNYAYYNNIMNGNWPNRQLDDEAKNRIKLIDKAIDGSTITENMYVYRNFDRMYIDKDGYITSKGYISTSLYKSPTEQYFDYEDIMKLRVPEGTKGVYVGANTMSMVAEYEILFGRDTKIRVIGRNKDNTIECEIVK